MKPCGLALTLTLDLLQHSDFNQIWLRLCDSAFSLRQPHESEGRHSC